MKKAVSLQEIIEEIAAAVVLADASNKSSVGNILQLFEELKELTAKQKVKSIDKKDVQKSIDNLYSIILGDSKDPAESLKEVSDNISSLQKSIHNLKDEAVSKEPGKSKKTTKKPVKKTKASSKKAGKPKKTTRKASASKEEVKEPKEKGLLQKLKSDVKKAKVSDKVTIGAALETMEQFEKECLLDPNHADRRFLTNSIKIMNSLILDETKKPEAALKKVVKAVDLIEQTIERVTKEDADKIDFFNMETPLAKRDTEPDENTLELDQEQLANEISALNSKISADDKPSVGKMLNCLEQFAKTQPDSKIKTKLQSVSDILSGLIIDSFDDSTKAVNDAKEQIKKIIDLCSDADGEKTSEMDVLDGIKSGDNGEIILPGWVDKIMFEEFVANQTLSIDDIESDLLDIENRKEGGTDAVKRRIHSLKGEAGVLGLTQLSELCHVMEDLVESDVPLNERVDCLLKAKDWIAQALEAYGKSRFPSNSCDDILKMLKEKLEQSKSVKSGKNSTPKIVTASKKVVEKADASKVQISVVSSANDMTIPDAVPEDRDEETVSMIGDFLAESQEGLATADSLLMELESEEFDAEKVNGLFRVFHTIKGVAGFLELMEITKLAHVTETMMNKVRQGSLKMEGVVFDLLFDATEMLEQMLANVRQAVENHTSFVYTVDLESLIGREQQVIDGIFPEEAPLPEAGESEKIGKVLEKGGVNKKDIVEALEKQKETKMPLGEQLVSDGKAKPKQVGQALRAQKKAGKEGKSSKIRETVKIDLDRIDSLLEMIGELVIVESMVTNDPEIVALPSLRIKNHLNMLGKITRDLQTVGMQMRMVPVRGVFQKMARMVRDLSRKGGKDIEFIQTGEATEMDRSMVEHISDPLVHMIRNSVDHGIEPDPAERTKLGKSKTGTIKLAAYHEGGNIVIEITDDGRGLDKEAIINKALSQKLVKEKDVDTMSDSEIYNLIFAPGFSTAKKVTEISGRGVGMDVVKRNIESMRGRVIISSKQGQGTSFKIVLPLTLAIIDGMLVACGKERYIIPTLSIVESIKPTKEILSSYADKWELLNVRGEILPLLRMDKLFGLEGAIKEPTDALVVIVECYGKKMGILVDDVMSQQQVVIKSIGSGMKEVNFISGAAIMSNGNVGLIVNVEEISALLADQHFPSAANG